MLRETLLGKLLIKDDLLCFFHWVSAMGCLTRSAERVYQGLF